MNLLKACVCVLVACLSLAFYHLFHEHYELIHDYYHTSSWKMTAATATTTRMSDTSSVWSSGGTNPIIPLCITFMYPKNLLDPKYLVQTLKEEERVRARNVNRTIHKFSQAWWKAEMMKLSEKEEDNNNNIPLLNYSVRFLSEDDCIHLINETEPRLFIPFMSEESKNNHNNNKADICRAVAQWHAGGYYLDVDLVVHEVPRFPPSTEFATVLEENHVGFQPGAFVAVAPKHPVMNLTLQVMVDYYYHQGGRQQQAAPLHHRHASIGSWSMREAYTRWIQEFPQKAESVYFLQKSAELTTTTTTTNQQSTLLLLPPEGEKMKSANHHGILDVKMNKLVFSLPQQCPQQQRPYNNYSESSNSHPNKQVEDEDEEELLPFMSTIHDQVFTKPQDFPPTPNFFETLERNHCLPDPNCTSCLNRPRTANCHDHDDEDGSCAQACPCYCQTLCKDPVPPKFVSKHVYVTPPLCRRDPNRIIPRMVHQTWMEPISSDQYPNLSRLVESFRQSGWDYKFYTDDNVATFLTAHFPSEVREAYDALKPGAFKADLFRYCVLLIYGGVYADVDVLLESSLDYAVPPDVGFMAPNDKPGEAVDRRMCLWNGFMAAAPGHPFLIQAIEMVVNQVRNRFTIVDMDASFCPNPELSVVHFSDTLYTSGPCLLGSAVNHVLGRHPQTSFFPGEIAVEPDKAEKENAKKDERLSWRNIPGRTIILSQNKHDMGAQRFTRKDSNLIVCATDILDSSDLNNNGQEEGEKIHYSQTHAWKGMYGLEGVYTDMKKANEDVRFYLVSS